MSKLSTSTATSTMIYSQLGESANFFDRNSPTANKTADMMSQKIYGNDNNAFMAGDEGIEPPTSVLETEVIPFN